ncbi:MAG: hypothetical protein ACREMT_11880, partial [Vulcanimicrobiaceae bacterium]
NMPSPLGEAMNALGQFTDAYTEKQRYNDEKKHRAQRESVEDSEWNKDYGLRQATTQSQLETAAQSRKIAAAREEAQEKLDPLVLEGQTLENQLKRGQIDEATARQKLLALQIKEQAVKTAIAQKYGVKLADLDVQQKSANVESTKAGTANTNAATALTQAETSNVRAGLGTGGTGGRDRRSIAAQTLEALQDLSPQGLDLYKQITTMPTSLSDALLKIRASKLSADDKRRLEMIVEAPRIVLGSSPKGGSSAIGVQRMQSNPKFGALPAGVQQMILKRLRAGVSIEGIILEVEGTTMNPQQKQSVIDVLQSSSGANNAPAPPSKSPPASSGQSWLQTMTNALGI